MYSPAALSSSVSSGTIGRSRLIAGSWRPRERNSLFGDPHLVHVSGHKSTRQVPRDGNGLTQIQIAEHVEVFPADLKSALSKKVAPLPADSNQFDFTVFFELR